MDNRKKDFELYFMTGGSAREHMHQDVEFIYVMDGCIRVTALGKTFLLGGEDAMIINSNHRHSWLEVEKTHLCIIHFNYSMLLEYLDKKLIFFYCNSSKESSERYEGIREIMDDLLSECAVNADRMTFEKKSLLYRLLQYLIRYFMSDDILNTAEKDDLRIEEMLQYINTNYARSLSLQEMAEYMHMAPSSFSRFFKKRAGITFVEYVNNVRLHFALEDILYTTNSVSWIAQTHGFANASVFCKNFKAVYGMAPMVYRKQMANASAPQVSSGVDQQFLKKYLKRNESGIWESWKKQFIQASVDCRECRPWKNPWNEAVHLGTATELLNADLRSQIIESKEHLGFTYGRILGIFGSEMQFRAEHAHKITNYNSMDSILDFLIRQKIRPIISLDNKPIIVFRSANSYLYEKKSELIFEDMTECKAILDDFLNHIVHRYGMSEVKTWKFDCWYDEFYENTMGIPGSFLKIFGGICGEIKRFIPDAQVGGCGLSISINEKKFHDLLDTWVKEPVKPDFISINLYPYSQLNISGKLRAKRHLNTNDYYQSEVLRCRDVINEYGWADVPLYVIEWNMSMSQRNFFNDTCGKAALMVSQMVRLMDVVDLAAYNGLSDLSGLYTDTSAFLMGGSGLLTASGVRKPAYYALQFMSRLGNLLVKKDANYIVTTNGCDDYQILCFNAKNLRYKYYAKEESSIVPEEIEDIFENKDTIEITFSLTNLSEGDFFVREYRVIPWRHSVLDAWKYMGTEYEMDAEDIEYLKSICVPVQKKGRLKVSGGKLVFQQSIRDQEIKFIHLYR